MDVGGRAKQDARAEDRRFGARSDREAARHKDVPQPVPLGTPYTQKKAHLPVPFFVCAAVYLRGDENSF